MANAGSDGKSVCVLFSVGRCVLSLGRLGKIAYQGAIRMDRKS